MSEKKSYSIIILGVLLLLAIIGAAFISFASVIKFKTMDRTVTVKGLSEREYEANIVIWPIKFSETDNNLTNLYNKIETKTKQVENFLLNNGITKEEISFSAPKIIDKQADIYRQQKENETRFIAEQTITIYSQQVKKMRKLMSQISQLGKKGIVFTSNNYEIEYKFTKLNEIKPQMIEEATKNAREVANKFANDSESKLGKIKNAKQGQFSIYNRDNNNPHIKTVRVVSTVQYYLSD